MKPLSDEQYLDLIRQAPVYEVARRTPLEPAPGLLAARRLGLRAVIVMPKTTPEIKVDSVRQMGAKTVAGR